MSQSELSRRAGIPQSTINSIITKNRRSSPHLIRLARELETTPEYLMGESDDPALAAVAAAPVEPSPTSDDEVEIEQLDLAYGMGGTFLDVVTDVEGEKARFSRAWLRQFTEAPPHMLFSAKGIGDSMMPTIHDRDVIIVDRSDTRPRLRDQIWAIAHGDIGMVKRLRPMPDGTMRIVSDNPAVPEDLATDGELHIVGRVVAICRKV